MSQSILTYEDRPTWSDVLPSGRNELGRCYDVRDPASRLQLATTASHPPCWVIEISHRGQPVYANMLQLREIPRVLIYTNIVGSDGWSWYSKCSAWEIAKHLHTPLCQVDGKITAAQLIPLREGFDIFLAPVIAKKSVVHPSPVYLQWDGRGAAIYPFSTQYVWINGWSPGVQ